MEPWVLTGYANIKVMYKKYSYTDKYNGSVVRLSIAGFTLTTIDSPTISIVKRLYASTRWRN
jgi:hypothetical protein